MKTISRDAIQRMTGSGSGGVSVGGGGGASIDLTGYATEMWTEENYVGKEFFSSLFKAYDSNGNEVLPNDTDTQIDNIKAMFGFWTDFYISALGTGGQSTVGLRLSQLDDVNVAGVTNGQVLTYDTTSGKWIASTPQSGTDMATVWANLAANGNQQINASHLTTALTGYATQTWVGQQGYITSSALTGYATQTWVGQNYLSKNDAAETYLSKTAAANTYLSIAFFNRLFKAYNGTTRVNPNDTAAAIDNIKAMFGFWTEFYISALGTGGQSTVGLRLAQLADVNVAGVQNDQVLKYDATSQKWVPGTASSGTDMATVWSNLAANGNQQINYSHLSGAVSLSNGTITIGSASITPITSHQSLAGYAKELWVGQNYLPLAGGTITGSLTVNNTLSTGGNTTVGGDLTVNGGDVFINDPSGASVLNFQTGGTTRGNLRVKPSNNELYFYTGSGDSTPGCMNADWFYAYTQVTALSDARKKNVVGDIALTIEQIANAPAVKFYWKDKHDEDLHVGSIAQYWQKVLPETVKEKNGELAMDYSVIALMSGITIARKVEDHESRLRRLEKMFALNENDIED